MHAIRWTPQGKSGYISHIVGMETGNLMSTWGLLHDIPLRAQASECSDIFAPNTSGPVLNSEPGKILSLGIKMKFTHTNHSSNFITEGNLWRLLAHS